MIKAENRKKIKSYLFSNVTARQTVAKNTMWMATGQIGGRLLRAAIIIYAARILGAAEWGIFSYAVSFAAFLTIFIDLGIGPVLTREAAKTHDTEKRFRILSTSFVIKTALLIIGILIVLFIAPQLSPLERANILFPIIALIMIFDTIREFGFALIRALQKMEWEAGLYTLTNVSIVAFGIVALKIWANVVPFAYSYALGTAIGMIATLYVLRTYFRKIASHFDRSLVKPLLTAAWPFAISAVLGGLMVNSDILIIGYFGTASDVGFYASAERIMMILYLLPSVFATSIFPLFSRLAAEAKSEKMKGIFEKTIGLSYMVALPLAIGGAITAPLLLTTLFGEAFAPGGMALRILLITIIANFPAVIFVNLLFANNYQRYLVVYAIIGGVGNILLDFVLIPKFGIAGSAVATLFSQILGFGYLWLKVRQFMIFSLPPLRKILASLTLMTVVSIILLYARLPFMVIVGISSVVYVGSLYLLKENLLREIKLTLKPFS